MGRRPPVSGDFLARLAEQCGATADDPAPIRDAAEMVRGWRASGYVAPTPDDQWTYSPFYAGRTAMSLVRSGGPVWAFTEPEFIEFRWGIAPVPRLHRTDAHVTYWRDRGTAVRANAPDPVAAFAVIAAIVSDGPLWARTSPSTAHRTACAPGTR